MCRTNGVENNFVKCFVQYNMESKCMLVQDTRYFLALYRDIR